jgi:hypothetical protein
MTSDKSYDNAGRLDLVETRLAVVDANGWVNVPRNNSWAIITGSQQASPAVTFMDYANRFVLFTGALSTGTVADGTSTMTVPLAYRPQNAKVPFAVGTLGGSPTLTGAPYFEIQLNGDVQCYGIKAAMLSVRWTVAYAIDAPAA